MPPRGKPSPQDALSPEEILRVLEDRTQAAQDELARRTDAGQDVLDYLARNGRPATRRAVAANIAAAPETNRHLAGDDDTEVRAELARKIARLLPDLSRDEADHIRAITVETLERLARDQETRVRAVLADAIKHLDCVPRGLVLALARDVEIVVAGPVLEYSPLLSDADLIELIAGAAAEDALAAIARRRPLGASVSDAIVSALDIPAIAALLANPDAAIRKETLDTIVEQAENIGSWHMPLVLRVDLSARVIRRIAGFVGAGLIEKLSERHALDRKTRAFLQRELRRKLEAGEDESISEADKAMREVADAADAGKLNAAFVEAAAEAGRREAVIAALASLARAPAGVVRRILETRSAKPVTALVWHAGLSMRAAFKIQTGVMKLPAQDLLAARGGVHFPLSEDEMRWHLAYFDIAAEEGATSPAPEM